MDAATFMGKTVICVQSGADVGRVEELLFDLQTKRLWALQLRTGGQPALLPLPAIQAIGADVLMTSSLADLVSPAFALAKDQYLTLAGLRRVAVVDVSGKKHGVVTAVDVNPVSGEIVRLRAHRGGLLGIGGHDWVIKHPELRGMGTQVLVIAPPVERRDASPPQG